MEAVETKMRTSLEGVTLLEHKFIEGIRKALNAVLNTASEARCVYHFQGHHWTLLERQLT